MTGALLLVPVVPDGWGSGAGPLPDHYPVIGSRPVGADREG